MTKDTSPVPDAQGWLHIRARYEQAIETVAQIAETIGFTSHGLTLKAKAEGWMLRSQHKRKIKKQKLQSTTETIRRLKELLQKRVGNLEAQLDEIGVEVNALSSERDIRSTNTLVRTLEKVLELEHKDRRQKRSNAKDNKRTNAADRAELARRIANLVPPSNPPEGSGVDEAVSSSGIFERMAALGEGGSTSTAE